MPIKKNQVLNKIKLIYGLTVRRVGNVFLLPTLK